MKVNIYRVSKFLIKIDNKTWDVIFASGSPEAALGRDNSKWKAWKHGATLYHQISSLLFLKQNAAVIYINREGVSRA